MKFQICNLLWMLLTLMTIGHCAVQFQLAALWVDDEVVSARTYLNFEFSIARASKSKVRTNDYLEIVIPGATSARWDTTKAPICSMKNGGEALKCEILSEDRCRITLRAQQNLVIRGSISNFINPISVREVTALRGSMYRANGQLDQVAASLSLSLFRPSAAQVTLSSSSKVIGSSENVLSVKVKPASRLDKVNLLLLDIPEYYAFAGTDMMISERSPTPCTISIGTLHSCKFSERYRQVQIEFHYDNVKDDLQEIEFRIGNFKNPITESMGGFSLQITDADEYAITKSASDLTISGMSEAAQFKSWDFHYVNTNASGQWAEHMFVLQSSMPIKKNCRVKIIYPPSFNVTKKAVQFTGTGFFAPLGEAMEAYARPENNSLEIFACNKQYGSFMSGTISVSQIMNQEYVHNTKSFVIWMTEATDAKYLKKYQIIDDGFIVPKEQQRPGAMTGKLSAESNLVQTYSPLSFELEPTMNLNGKTAYIVVSMPKSMPSQGPSCTVDRISGGLNPKMACSRINFELTLINPFIGYYDASNSEILKFRLQEFLMPTGVQHVGTIRVRTYDIRAGKYRPIDMVEFNSLSTRGGEITKLSDVTASSKETSLADQTYTFHFKVQHAVPLGGQFSIVLSQGEDNGVGISNVDKVEKNCFLVSETGEEKGLDCKPGYSLERSRPYVNITCTRGGFGDVGSPAGSSFKFKISGLTNPRMRYFESLFSIYTLDTELRYIDENFEDQKFSITMTELHQMTSVTVQMSNLTNGAITSYTLQIVSTTSIRAGDLFTIRFPPEIIVPLEVKCESGKTATVTALSCNRMKQNSVQIILDEVDGSIQDYSAGVEFVFLVHGVQNAPSLRPSKSFTNMVFMDSETNLDLTEYSQSVTVQTKQLGQIRKDTASIHSSSNIPSQDTMIDLTFSTNNPLNSQATILVSVPDTIPVLYTESESCYIQVNGKKITSVCSFLQHQVIYSGAFLEFPQPFVGVIQLFFKIQNPKDNQGIHKYKQAYGITSYDDKDMIYGIDELKDTLYPEIACMYPCKSCKQSNRAFCTECLPPNADGLHPPQFLHYVKPDLQTCVDHCPVEDGFTSNGSRNPRRCTKCADTCAECAQEDQVGDRSRCTVCKAAYPFKWDSKETCHSGRCPDGSYLAETVYQEGAKAGEEGKVKAYHCTSCPGTCEICESKVKCTQCLHNSKKPMLVESGYCNETCADGTTPINGKCVACQAPCGTCAEGQVNSCLSCDNTAGKFFLYGRSCLKQCPINTTLSLAEEKCLGCKTGCQLCDDQDSRICLRCSEGLAYLDNECLEQCPQLQYKRSEDGSVCERRNYELDRTFVAFPILGTASFFVLITLSSYWLTAHRSLIYSSLIAFFGPIEMAACLYQFIYSLQPDRNYLPIKIGSICVFTSGVILNLVFIVNFHKVVKNSDKEFERWRRDKKYSSNFILMIAGCLSITMYRLIYCRMFRLDMLSVKVSKPQPFLKPIFMFTWIKMLVFNLPLIVVDMVGLSSLSWGNQCYMTNLESLLLSCFSLILMILEYRNRDALILREARAINLDKMELMEEQEASILEKTQKKQSKKNMYKTVLPDDHGRLFKSQTSNPINLQNIDFQLQNNASATQVEIPQPELLVEYQLRIDQLSIILDAVKANQNTLLNNQVDNLMEHGEELAKGKLRRIQSCCDIKGKDHNQLQEVLSDMSSSGLCQRSFASYGYQKVNEEAKLKIIHDYFKELKEEEFDKENFEIMFTEQEENEPAHSSPKNPTDPDAPSIESPGSGEIQETEVQITEHEKVESPTSQMDELKELLKIQVAENLAKVKAEKKLLAKKRAQFRKGKKSFLENDIHDENESDSAKSDKFAQAMFQTEPFDHENVKIKDIFTVAMQVEKKQSLTSLYDIERINKEQMEKLKKQAGLEISEQYQSVMDNLNQTDENLLGSQQEIKGIELSRVSGDLVFSEQEEDESDKIDSEAQRVADLVKRENVQAWIKDSTDQVNQRTFNVNDIMGDFKRDRDGGIYDRDYTLQKSGYYDRKGNLVNDKGYLIDENTGDVRSMYTFDVVFNNHKLLGIGENRTELPLPFRMEKFNFNPHDCLGNFDYDKREKKEDAKPIILKDRNGNKVDKNLRRVNGEGWLIDQVGNVVDNLGQVKFVVEQLKPNGDIPNLFNFDGIEYNIKNIIGLFERDKNSKEIILCHTKASKFTSCDMQFRKVNSKGYLLDARGNIIDKNGKLIWRSHELMYNEPMKLFPFTEFSINWIKGHCTRDVTLNPRHDDEYDDDGKRINTMGYLIDGADNVIDVFNGNILFKREVLEDRWGQEAEIPYVFRSGQLKEPEMDVIEYQLINRNRSRPNLRKHKLNEDMDLDHDSVRNSEQVFPMQLPGVRNMFGQLIEDIPFSQEQQALMGDSQQLDNGSQQNDFRAGEFTENARDPRSLPPRPQTGKHAQKTMLQRFPNPARHHTKDGKQSSAQGAPGMAGPAHIGNSNSQGHLPNLPKIMARNNFIDSN